MQIKHNGSVPRIFRFYRECLVAFVTLFSLFVFSPSPVQAQAACRGVLSGVNVTLPKFSPGNSHTIRIDMSTFDPTKTYFLRIRSSVNFDDESQSMPFKVGQNGTFTSPNAPGFGKNIITVTGNIITWQTFEEEALTSQLFSGTDDEHHVFVGEVGAGNICKMGTYKTIKNNTSGQCKLFVSQQRNNKTCFSSGCMEADSSMQTKIEVENLQDATGQPFNGEVRFVIGVDGIFNSVADQKAPASNGSATASFKTDDLGRHTIVVEEVRGGVNFPFPGCSTAFTVSDFCAQSCDETRTDVAKGSFQTNFELCEQLPAGSAERGKCESCFGGDALGGVHGVWTAIGCIPAKPDSIVKTFMTLGLSLGGGATLLLILAGAFRLSASQGDPQATKDAKEQITSALIGLVFIIFSITILRFIGVTLLNIPGFGT